MTARTSSPARRIMAIWLPRLAIDRWRHSENCKAGEGADADPLALIAETAHGPRIEAVNAAALAAGIRIGALLADARSVCPSLAVRASDSGGDHAFLERLAVWAQRWGPWSAVDAPDGLLVDVTAVAHLFGGETAMLEEAQARLAQQGLAARLAIAPTCGAAWALAHCARRRPILQTGEEAILDRLPVAGLRLNPDVLLVLRRLGLKRIGDLHPIERDALQRRFRNRRDPAANPLIRLDQLLGRAAEPLLPAVLEEMPLVQRRLLEPIRHRELLDMVVADLAQDIARLLESKGQGARRLELGLWRVDNETAIRPLELSAATCDPAHIARLFATKLNDIDAGFGIELVRMCAPWCEALSIEQGDIEAVEVEGITLSACIDRLTVRLGEGVVRRPVPYASYIPERAQRWRPPLEPRASQEEMAFHERPLKLLDRPEEIAVLYKAPDGTPRRFSWRGSVHDIARVEGPERIAPEWWRERSTVRLRDYYRIEDIEGRRYWIWRDGFFGDGRGGDPQWFLQGLFA